MTRVEHWRDPEGPVASRVAVAVFGVAQDENGAVLLVKRADTGNWEPPGGHVDPGESLTDATIREICEESGVRVKVTGMAGVYSDPDLVLTYPTGESRQQVAIYFHTEAVEGAPTSDHSETLDAVWVVRNDLDGLPMHPVVRKRLDQVLIDPTSAHIG